VYRKRETSSGTGRRPSIVTMSTAKPQTGLWFAVPEGRDHQIKARFVSNQAELAHPGVWRDEIAPALAKSLKLSPAVLAELAEAPYGCPRGRVVSPEEHSLPRHKGRWVVLFGGDDDLPRAARPSLLKAFGLSGQQVAWVLDDHERMLPEDREILTRALQHEHYRRQSDEPNQSQGGLKIRSPDLPVRDGE
jgi:hypothetical protein